MIARTVVSSDVEEQKVFFGNICFLYQKPAPAVMQQYSAMKCSGFIA